MNKTFLIEYQDNFIDNLSNYAYSKILENKKDVTCYYINNPIERKEFESKMSNFYLECRYISQSRLENFNKKNLISNKTLTLDDFCKLPSNFIENLNFSNTDFIKNYDILEKIKNSSSIGVYFNNEDLNENNLSYLKKATKRLNKYIKQPKLYTFCTCTCNLDIDIKYEFINIENKFEEFYFLNNCTHKIIINSEKSYSAGFLASVLNKKDYSYVICDKELKTKNRLNNWIYI